MSAIKLFPNVDALLEAVEHETASLARNRFCSRFLLVSTATQWNTLIQRLRATLHPQELRLSAFTTDGAMPQLDLWKKVSFSKIALLLPFMEGVRFCTPEKRDIALTSVATFPGNETESGPARLYVPLLCSPKMLEDCLHQRCDRFREGLLPEIWALPEDATSPCVVLAPTFLHGQPDVTEGLASYLTLWEQAVVPPSCLVRTPVAKWTKFAKDAVAVVCAKPRAVVEHVLPLQDISALPESTPEVFWQGMLLYAHASDVSLQSVANRLLNFSEFRPEDVAVVLQERTTDTAHGAVLWVTLQHWSKTASGYLAAVCRSLEDPRCLGAALYQAALSNDLSQDDLTNRCRLLRRMVDISPPRDFLDSLRTLPPRKRLTLLTDASQDERILAVQTAGELLAQGYNLAMLSLWLAPIFPLLAEYLAPLEGDTDLRDYFQRFAEARLCNSGTPELRMQQQKIATQRQDLPHTVPPRAQVLAQVAAPTRWMDGLGLEWHGVARAAAQKAGVRFTLALARASLPTTTSSNKEWSSSDEKSAAVDSLGHAGEYTFPLFFLKQLAAVESFVRDLSGKLRRGALGGAVNRLALTGDHGLTPVVFHTETLPVPPGFEVRKGRALERKNPEAVFPESLAVEGEYCYIRGLGRFEGGQTKGTIHGGATLEELLVPVITLSLDVVDTTVQPPALRHAPTELTLSPLGEVTLELTLSRPSANILLERDEQLFMPETIRDNMVVFRLRGLPPGKIPFSLYAEQHQLGTFIVQLSAGLDMNDMGI